MARGRRIRLRRSAQFFWALLLVLITFYLFVNSPFFALQQVEVQGNEQVDEQVVLELAGIAHGENIWRVDALKVAQKVEVHPLIKKAELTRRLPGEITIKITEREPFALVAAADGGFWEIDREGHALRHLEVIDQLFAPVILGVRVPNGVVPGQQAVADPNLGLALQVLVALDPNLRLALGEVDLTVPDRIKVFTREGVEIRLGSREGVEDRLASAIKLLRELPKDQEIEYLDFSSKPVIMYR